MTTRAPRAQAAHRPGHRAASPFEPADDHKDPAPHRDENGKETNYRFTLETGGNPRLIALKAPDAQADSAPVKAAYAVDRDALMIVIAPAGSRPTEMSDRNNQELIVCKRKSS